MGIFYIVGTPIGNLSDITFRAIDILKGVDVILAEDTRVTKKLLSNYKIQKPVWRADAKTEREIGEKVLRELISGKNVAFVSDAGTPNISDPGAAIVSFISKGNSKISIVPIPGVSAITTLLSVCGLSGDRFTFLGYPPHKKGRESFFMKLKDIKTIPIVMYESPHRIEKTLRSICDIFGAEKEVVLGRELTKIHEDIFRGTISGAINYFVGEKKKGEFVVIIS